jgi:D-alanyl-D-alanine carboxypeptidase
MKHILILIIFSGLIYPIKFRAQIVNTKKLDSLFDVISNNNKGMGSICIYKSDKSIYKRNFGYAKLTHGQESFINDNTLFRIGSITKVFTATMIFQLIDEKKITLDDTISKFYKDQKYLEKITIGNLLNHKSGLHDYTTNDDYDTWSKKAVRPENVLSRIFIDTLEFEPSKKYAYSNSNYFLLGDIIEKVTGKSYEYNLMNRICLKVNLKNTFTEQFNTKKINESHSFELDTNWNYLLPTHMDVAGGAGQIISTTEDLCKLNYALFNSSLTSRKSLMNMMTINEGYGMGLLRMPFYKRNGYGHNGAIDGYAANLVYFPEDSISIAYCTNAQVYPLNNIMIGVLSIVFNKNYKIPDFKTISIDPTLLKKYCGLYYSEKLNMKLKISSDRSKLNGQADGQSIFLLEPKTKDSFQYFPSGIIIEFNTQTSELILFQNGGKYLFKKVTLKNE